MARRVIHPTATRVLLDRDRRILQLVGTYRVVSSLHVHALLFADVGYTPVDRALKRLVERDYLIRVERRLVGQNSGGSGHYLYELTRPAWRMLFEGEYRRAERSKLLHYLAVVDCVVVLRELEREGELSGLSVAAEPDCWAEVGGFDLRPDLYASYQTSGGRWLALWFEVDMASQGEKTPRQKIARYVGAYGSSEGGYDPFPGILWVAIDSDRAEQLRRIVASYEEDVRRLFRVVELSRLSEAMV